MQAARDATDRDTGGLLDDAAVRRATSRRRRATKVGGLLDAAAVRQAKFRGRAMKVLLVSHLHPELLRGGAQQACYELFLGLNAEPDVEAFFLAGVEPGSYPALYKPGARITGFDGRSNEFLFLSASYDFKWHRTTSLLHVEAYAELLRTIRPDVVHFQHFLLLGIDFLTLTRTVLPGCRIVFTFHDYLTMCAARGHMVRLTDGSLCAQPSPIRCHQCLPEHSPGHFLMRKLWFLHHLSAVDRYACACRFQIEHHVAWGIDRKKIFHVPTGQLNYAPASLPAAPEGPKNRFGFFGQLIDAKGVHITLRAVRILRDEGFSNFTVELNGDNLRFATPAVREEIETFLREEEERPWAERNVFHNGSYQVDQIGGRMLRIDWCLVPSIWWESFGLVITEAWMFKRPVICSNVGGMAERIAHDANGLHFQVGDPRALAAAIRRAATEPGLWERLSTAAPEPHSRQAYVKDYRTLYLAD
jgi:glycosyltransferase involved in cell wall biosynthesis